jgi:phytoene desaturase
LKTAIIVGSGIAGIASSIRLAVKGYEVKVFEKNTYAGGKLSVFEQDGYRFDAGPSLFTMPQFVEELFVLAGKKPKDYFEYIKHDTACHYFWNDGTTFFAPSKSSELAKKAHKVFGVTEESVTKKLKKAAFINDKVSGLFLEQSLHKIKGFLNKETLVGIANMPRLDLNKNLHQVNEKDFNHPKMVQIFDRFATYNGSSPFQTPGIMGVIPHYEHNVGTFFPKKGMHSITTSLVKLAEDLGVAFHYDEMVEEINYAGNKVEGVQTTKGTYTADIAVSNMDVYYTYHKLLKNFKIPHKTLNRERSSSALIFYWGIQKKFENLDLHNIFFADDYKAEFEAIFKTKQIYNDPTVYIHISSKLLPSDAPENCENWFVMINTPPEGNIDWDVYIEMARENIIKKISTILKEDISKLIQSESILEPRTIESKTMSYQGSLYGTSSNSKFSAFLRHPNFSKKLKNLYFVGGSAHPGGGIPLCLLSAKIVAENVE